ncbi:LysR substrate-binding domain-containing protein [Stutzerimonas kirkiae]|uniref:LysR substrate-binding domain-containing protein n=1 Tax=Stutzerimonas kirkiae TaxID=2211392 RepID=UPI0010385A39|nr:LysR substrate-binding domain-containing protein [Stutzerimonas kirkiae]TBV08038.1 LysR family transcriptional regulator [Stutzerimonas kirkiae]TBV15815.1 LysR family transcriptional regulator [Stutzerimonas kirkiae]
MSQALPPLYALRAFEAAARHGSFTAAAHSLCLTQSAISRHVKTLERHFERPLFIRHGARLELTLAGHHLAQELERGFSLIEAACAATLQQRGSLRLKAPSTLSMRWLLPVLGRFHAENQGKRVQLSSVWMDEDHVDFRNEPFDCALLLSDGNFPAGWQAQELFKEWLVPVCTPAFRAEGEWNLERLLASELIHSSPDRRDWIRWLQRQGITDPHRCHTGPLFDTLELGINAAAQGHGISIGDLSLVARELDNGQLVMPLANAVGTGDSYYFVWPEQQDRHPVRAALGRCLRENLPRPPASLPAFLE